jgi:hypothetical protein
MVHSKYGRFKEWLVVLGLVILGMVRSRYGPFWEWLVLGMVTLGMVVLGLVQVPLYSFIPP